MKKLFGFVGRLALIVGLVIVLADQPGNIRIVWHDTVLEMSTAVLCLGVFALGFIVYLMFRLWHLLHHGPGLWRLHRHVKGLRRGHDDITAGLAAIAAGDATEAGRRAAAARQRLGATGATRFLEAQAAHLAGDTRRSCEIFRVLADDPDNAVLGYRGLIMLARRRNDFAEISRLTAELQRLKPDTPWLGVLRFNIAVHQQKWEEACSALAVSGVAALMGDEKTRHARSAILIATSSHEAQAGNIARALQVAEQALHQAPDWLPAILNLVTQQIAAGHRRAAQRLIEKHWVQRPHPQLATLYTAGCDNRIEAMKKIEKLCRSSGDAPASRLALAEAALAADLWGEARRHLNRLVQANAATQGVYRLLARVERRETGNEQLALQWMTRAAESVADPVWLCHSCGGTHPEWQANCRHCRGFNTLDWQSPGMSRVAADSHLLLTQNWVD